MLEDLKRASGIRSLTTMGKPSISSHEDAWKLTIYQRAVHVLCLALAPTFGAKAHDIECIFEVRSP
jgi:hypothetical protein